MLLHNGIARNPYGFLINKLNKTKRGEQENPRIPSRVFPVVVLYSSSEIRTRKFA